MARNNGWDEYKRLILHEMKENSKKFDKLFDAIEMLRLDVGGLKVKAAIAGGMAGIVGTGLMSLAIKLWK